MHLIFDLDGTLADTRSGIQYALLRATREVFPEQDVAAGRFEIGPPVREMFRRAFPAIAQAELNRLERAFRTCYDAEGCTRVQAYPGVDDTLKELGRRGATLYLVTNKPARATARILKGLELSGHFRDVLSPDTRQPEFPGKAAMLEHLLRNHNVPVSDACYVGDSVDDSRAAAACGIAFVGVEFGYGKIAPTEGVMESVATFPELLKRLPNLGAQRRVP